MDARKLVIYKKYEDIIIRNMEIEDVNQMTKWGSHKDFLYSDYNFPKYNLEDCVFWYKAKNKKNKITISIERKGQVIGYISLREINSLLKTAVFGIVLNPDLINQGYGYIALKLFRNWFFNDLKFKKLSLKVAIYNKRAMKVYKKLGFLEKGYIYEEFLNEDVDLDDYDFPPMYFKREEEKVFVLCKIMELSTISTKKHRFSVDIVDKLIETLKF